MTGITIDKGVPYNPGRRRGSKPEKYPLAAMDVGDSFFYACAKSEATRVGGNILHCARLRWTDRQYSYRQVTEKDRTGVRVWRLS